VFTPSGGFSPPIFLRAAGCAPVSRYEAGGCERAFPAHSVLIFNAIRAFGPLAPTDRALVLSIAGVAAAVPLDLPGRKEKA